MWRAGPHSIIGENLVVRSLRIWTAREYPKGADNPVTIRMGVQRQGDVAWLSTYRQAGRALNANTSTLITGENPLNYPLQKGDVLVAEWDTQPVSGVICEFQLTRVGGVSENVAESREGVIAGRDIERPLFSAHAQDEEAVARLARQINESGVPDVSIPIYLWDAFPGTPFASVLLTDGVVFAGGGEIEIVPYSIFVEEPFEYIYDNETFRSRSTVDSVHAVTASVRLLDLAINTHVRMGGRAFYADGSEVDFWLEEIQSESADVELNAHFSTELFVRKDVVEYAIIIQITGDTNVETDSGFAESRLAITQFSSAFAPTGPAGAAGPPGAQGPPGEDGGGATVFTDLTDVPPDYVGHEDKMVVVNPGASGLVFAAPPAPGVNTFLGLIDTPPNYTDDAGKVVAVKAAEDGLEFVVPSGGSPQYITQGGVSYSGAAYPSGSAGIIGVIQIVTGLVPLATYNLDLEAMIVLENQSAAGATVQLCRSQLQVVALGQTTINTTVQYLNIRGDTLVDGMMQPIVAKLEFVAGADGNVTFNAYGYHSVAGTILVNWINYAYRIWAA